MSLPSGYKRLEYIKSSGTQYINTNLSMASGFRAEIDIEFTSLASSILSCVIGAHNDSSPYGRNFLAAQTSLFQIGMGDGYYNFGSPTTGEKYHIDFSNVYGNAYCKINGIGQALSEAATGTNSYSVNTLYLLAVHGGESWFQKVSGNTYHCKIYSTEGTLVRDYIPCQTTAGEIGLWDDVNSVFYGNAGTGTFTAGPVVITAPQIPAGFTASALSDTTVQLNWAASDGATGYKLYKNGALLSTLTETSYTDTVELFSSTVYAVTAYNDDGESEASTLIYHAVPENPILYLVTDRTAEDVTAHNVKGTYRSDDMNRVGAAMEYVADRLKAQGYDPHISPKTDWMDGEWVTPADEAVYLGDLAELRKQFTLYETTPEVPPDLEKLNYIEANSIEQILVDIDALLTNIAAGWLCSGEIYSGEV